MSENLKRAIAQMAADDIDKYGSKAKALVMLALLIAVCAFLFVLSGNVFVSEAAPAAKAVAIAGGAIGFGYILLAGAVACEITRMGGDRR